MASGQMQVNRRIGNVAVAEQYLNGAQIGTCFEHVRRKAMAQSVRRDMLFDTCSFSRFGHRIPDHPGNK